MKKIAADRNYILLKRAGLAATLKKKMIEFGERIGILDPPKPTIQFAKEEKDAALQVARAFFAAMEREKGQTIGEIYSKYGVTSGNAVTLQNGKTVVTTDEEVHKAMKEAAFLEGFSGAQFL